jgi:hypothetical protein
MKGTKMKLITVIKIIIALSIGYFLSKAFAGEGPNDIKDVPKGMKLVKIDSECKDKDPCEAQKKEIEKLNKEIVKLKADNERAKKDLTNAEFQTDCPAPEIKTVYKTKEIPVEKIVEKKVETIVEKPAKRGLTLGLMGAYAQDGLSTSPSPTDEYAVDAYIYKSFIAGPYVTIPIGESFEAGLFGMFGGVNQTIGGKVGYMFK